jgi:SpoVK/Ycf46/Vps4 family AAA+-type ATPase
MVKKQKCSIVAINNYNKFLSTLDQSISNKKNYTINTIPIVQESCENTIIDMEQEMKNIIDKIIENLNNDFKEKDLSSSKFTGQTINDIVIANAAVNDPNEYKEYPYGDKNTIILNKVSCCKEQTQQMQQMQQMQQTQQRNKINTHFIPKEPFNKIKIKEHIHIDAEINNVSDILKLIENYKADPSIKYNINMKALHNIKEPLEELNHMIGMNDLKTNIVDQILYFVQELHKDKSSGGDFMHSVIYGPPGTGKTEIAKIMGKIYSKIGVLTNGTFKKVTRSDLIAGFLGQTALKTKDVIKEALGGVLFIDEAYALGNSEKRDSFAKECIDTLCEALSDNKANLMVIVAGYENELKDCFFDYNQGLESRFTWRFKTDEYNFEDLYHIFLKKVKEIGWQIEDNSGITSEWFKKNKEYFKFYGRDIETILAKTKIAHSKRVFCKPENEKRKINLADLESGLKIYLKNEEVKNRKSDLEVKRYLYNTLYS